MTGAIIGSAVVGAYSSHKAAKAQESGAKAQAATASSNLEFEKAKYAEQKQINEEALAKWEAMYGNTEKNIADTINTISARSYEVVGDTELEKHYAEASRRLTENLASRGIAGGQQISGQTQLLSDLASDKANNAISADSRALQDKANLFMNLGLQTKPGTNLPNSGNITLASNALGNAYNNIGTAKANGISAVGSNLASGIGALGGALGGSTPGSQASNAGYNTSSNGSVYNMNTVQPAYGDAGMSMRSQPLSLT